MLFAIALNISILALLSTECALNVATTKQARALSQKLKALPRLSVLKFTIETIAKYRTASLLHTRHRDPGALFRDLQYPVELEIRTSPQTVSLVLNTGSSDLSIGFAKHHAGRILSFNATKSLDNWS